MLAEGAFTVVVYVPFFIDMLGGITICNVYEVINNRIIELLKQGTVPWLHAAAQAQKSADYILNRLGGEDDQVADGTAE